MSLQGLVRPDERPDVRLYSSMYADQYDTVSHTLRLAAWLRLPGSVSSPGVTIVTVPVRDPGQSGRRALS